MSDRPSETAAKRLVLIAVSAVTTLLILEIGIMCPYREIAFAFSLLDHRLEEVL